MVSRTLFFAIALLTASACAADRVTYRSGEVEKTVIGEITEWTGDEITVRNTLGREATLPANVVIEVESPETPTQRAANAKFRAGEYSSAVELYMKAAGESKHQWKQRHLVADASRAYFEQQNWVTAAKRFLNVIAFDKTTPAYDAIPLFGKRPRSTPPPKPKH